MNKNTKLVLVLASSFLLMGCGGNSNSSSTPIESGSQSSSSNQGESSSSSSSSENIVLTIDEVSDILPKKSVQLVAKANGAIVEASYEIVEAEEEISSTISESGLFQAGICEEKVTVKATYKKASATTTVKVVAPVIDDSKLNIPASWKVSAEVTNEDETKEGVASFEFVKDKGDLLVDTLEDTSVGYFAEGGKLYRVLGTSTEAKFNYTDDVEKELEVADMNEDGNLSSVINAASLEFFAYDEESSTYEFDPVIASEESEDDEEETIDPIEMVMYTLGFLDAGFNSYTIQIDPETMALKEIVALAIDDEGYETDRLALNLTAIEDLSVTIKGEKVSDGGEGEGGVEEPFEPDQSESSEEGE